jgi:putative transposase
VLFLFGDFFQPFIGQRLLLQQLLRLAVLRTQGPSDLRSDNGAELVSIALLKRVAEQGIHCTLIDPGKPWQNGTTERFNGKFRDECLAMEWFRKRIKAKVVIEDWRQHYNTVRPHSSLGYETPETFSRKKSNEDLPAGAIPN